MLGSGKLFSVRPPQFEQTENSLPEPSISSYTALSQCSDPLFSFFNLLTFHQIDRDESSKVTKCKGRRSERPPTSPLSTLPTLGHVGKVSSKNGWYTVMLSYRREEWFTMSVPPPSMCLLGIQKVGRCDMKFPVERWKKKCSGMFHSLWNVCAQNYLNGDIDILTFQCSKRKERDSETRNDARTAELYAFVKKKTCQYEKSGMTHRPQDAKPSDFTACEYSTQDGGRPFRPLKWMISIPTVSLRHGFLRRAKYVLRVH